MRRTSLYAWLTWTTVLTLMAATYCHDVQAGVSVSPMKRELALRPGEQGTFGLTLTYHVRQDNATNDVAALSLADIEVSELGTVGFTESGTKPNSAGKWISLGNKLEIPLQPGESRTIECTVTPPLSAVPGEYYSAIMVTMANGAKTEQGIGVQFRIAAGVFVTVVGRTYPRTARITRCDFEWPTIAATEIPAPPTTQATTAPSAATQLAKPYDPKLVVILHNTGNVRFEATGKMILIDSHSRVVFSAPLETKRSSLFAGNTRRFESHLTKPLPPGSYLVKVAMDYGSTWNSARREFPLEILPEQSRLLGLVDKRSARTDQPIGIAPARLAQMIPAGATRSLALSVTNSVDVPLSCSAAIGSENPSPADAWITVMPEASTIARRERKSLRLSIHVPPEAPAGKYESSVTIQTTPEGADRSTYIVPIDIEVKTEKSYD